MQIAKLPLLAIVLVLIQRASSAALPNHGGVVIIEPGRGHGGPGWNNGGHIDYNHHPGGDWNHHHGGEWGHHGDQWGHHGPHHGGGWAHEGIGWEIHGGIGATQHHG